MYAIVGNACVCRPQDKSVSLKIIFSYFSVKTYVVGTQMNRLDETVLLSTPKHMFKLIDKKIIASLRKLFLLNWPFDMHI